VCSCDIVWGVCICAKKDGVCEQVGVRVYMACLDLSCKRCIHFERDVH
jgi:hypothetical protein